nr:mucin-1 isoform X2 [Globicephala melas]
MGQWCGGPEDELPGLAVQDFDLAHFLCYFSHLVCCPEAKIGPWGPRSGSRLPPPPSGAREWLVKGGGQLENKQVVRGLSDWSPLTLFEGPGMVGEEEEEEEVGGRERGRRRSFVTCHLLWLSLGRAWGGGTGIKQQAPVPAPPHAHCLPESVLPPPHHLATTMTPDIQAPFFFLLLLFLTVSATAESTSPQPSTSGTSSPTTSPASGSTAPPIPSGTSPRATSGDSPPTTSPASSSVVITAHEGTSSKITMTQASKGTPSSVPSSYTPTVSASHITRTTASSTNQSIVPPYAPNSSSNKTSQQLPIRVSLFFLSFRITNLQFNSSLENPSTSYYQKLQRIISVLFVQTYKQEDFLGLSDIEFRPGSVVVKLTLVFREGTTAHDVERQFGQLAAAAVKCNLTISGVSVCDASFPSSAQSGSGVPGWGIALLVLVCVLVALAIIYLIALVVCQCRQKNDGQLDLFPIQDAYHPMSEYPTYHTHGRYVPPGSTKRSPFEEVSAGNGGSTLSYANLAATSANL